MSTSLHKVKSIVNLTTNSLHEPQDVLVFIFDFQKIATARVDKISGYIKQQQLFSKL